MSEELLLDKKKNVRIKLLRTVGFWKSRGHKLEHIFFPPLALGILFAQLKQNGYNVSQDDLSIRTHYDSFDKNSGKKFCHSLFFQEERISKYVKSGIDDELEMEIEKISNDVNIKDVDIFLLSIPESLSNPSNILFVMAFSKFLKKRYSPEIVVGGHLYSIMLLQSKYNVSGIIDYIVVGSGEEAVIEVVDSIIKGRHNEKTNEVQIIHKSSNEIVIPDFTGLPFEKYRLSFLDYKDFSSDETLRDFFASTTSMLLFEFAKGCPNTCAFCGSSTGGLRVVLKPEEVVNAVEILQKKFNPTGYLFLNDTINISREYIKKICEIICEKNLNILWSACARVNGLDEEVISKMRKAGCVRLILGMETAGLGLLKTINKGITIEELENVLKLLSKYGIWTGIEVICGLPHETEEDIKATIDFLLTNRDRIDRIYCNIFDLRHPSLMFLNPEVYGIENIQEINLYRTEDNGAFNICNVVRFSFDETNGLNWEEKKKQMVSSFWRVVKATNAHDCLPSFLEEHFLFYMYSLLNEKNRIKKHYFEVLRSFQGNPSNIKR